MFGEKKIVISVVKPENTTHYQDSQYNSILKKIVAASKLECEVIILTENVATTTAFYLWPQFMIAWSESKLATALKACSPMRFAPQSG